MQPAKKQERIRVINIINHPPAYDAYLDLPRPAINWDDPRGDWVGIWGTEWHDKQGNLVLEVSDNIDYEVWQPDYRASIIYSHTFPNGLVHKQFPASRKQYLFVNHMRKEIFSDKMFEELDRLIMEKQKIVLHINALFTYMNYAIVKKYNRKIPVVIQFYNNSKKIFNPLGKKTMLRRLVNQFKSLIFSRYYKKIRYLIPSIEEGTEIFTEKFGINVFYRNFYNFPIELTNNHPILSKEKLREKLNLQLDKFIILSLSRLSPTKQIDKLMKALARVKKDFLLLVVGQGNAEYENYLKRLSKSLGLSSKVRFIGYINKPDINEYYLASDIFVSCSKIEGGPTTPFEAAALGIPAVITTTGIAFEFYKKHQCGVLMPNLTSNSWAKTLEKVISGIPIKVPDPELIKEFGNRHSISTYYRDIYYQVYDEFYKKK